MTKVDWEAQYYAAERRADLRLQAFRVLMNAMQPIPGEVWAMYGAERVEPIIAEIRRAASLLEESDRQ